MAACGAMSAVVRGRSCAWMAITTRIQGDTGDAGQTGREAGEQDARETTERWIDALNAALAGGQAAALSELFEADSHWRNLFGISWYFATFSGNADGGQRIAGAGGRGRAPAVSGSITAALAPRHAVVAGRDVDRGRFRASRRPMAPATARSGCCGNRTARRKAWTISTSLDFDAICDARAARRDRIPYPRFRRARLARAAAGLRGLRRPAIPTC